MHIPGTQVQISTSGNAILTDLNVVFFSSSRKFPASQACHKLADDRFLPNFFGLIIHFVPSIGTGDRVWAGRQKNWGSITGSV
jgi:hypothetical protein